MQFVYYSIVAIALTTFGALMLLAYLGWNAVGSPRVEAVQGRYLVPLIPLFVLALPRRARSDGSRRLLSMVVAVGSVLVLAVAFIGVRSRIY